MTFVRFEVYYLDELVDGESSSADYEATFRTMEAAIERADELKAEGFDMVVYGVKKNRQHVPIYMDVTGR